MQFNHFNNNSLMSGALFITPISARLTHDTDFFTRMDPFVIFYSASGQKAKTSVCYEGGRKPYWNEQLELTVTTQDRIVIEIWDHNTFTENEPIAVGELKVSKVLSFGGNYKDYVPVFWRGAPAGDLAITCSFLPASRNVGMNVGTAGMGVPGANVSIEQNTTLIQPNYAPQMAAFPIQKQSKMGQDTFYPQQVQPSFVPFPQQQVTETVTVNNGYPAPSMNYAYGSFPQQTQTPNVVFQEVIIENPHHHHGHHHHHHHFF